MISLSGDHRMQEISKGVWVLDRPDPTVSLQRPDRDLHGMPRGAAVAPRESIAVLRPEL